MFIFVKKQFVIIKYESTLLPKFSDPNSDPRSLKTGGAFFLKIGRGARVVVNKGGADACG